MAHEALARKYRPQTFADLVGQEPIAQTLQNAVREGRIHSAYLFTGTRGVGKTTTARLFAKALNCEQGPIPEPCDRCDACRDIAAGRSVDVQEIDAASHTKVEETRELMGRVAYAPAKGRYRVFIIDEAHMLSKSSFNALLKTLEEPPAHAVFILATTEPQKILETVRSRCIEFNFRRIPAARIATTLANVLGAEGLDFEAPALDELAIEADGSMRDALSLTDQVLGFAAGNLTADAVAAALGLTGRDVVAKLWQAIFAGEPPALIQSYREAYQTGADLRRLAIDMLELLREILLVQSGVTRDDPLIARVAEAAGARSLSDLHRMFDRLHAACIDLERSPVPDIVLETALLRLATLEPLGKLEDVIAALGSGGAPAAGAPSGGGRAPAAPARSAAGTAAAPPAPAAAAAVARDAAPAPSAPAPTSAPAPAPSRPAATTPADADVLARICRDVPSVESVLLGRARWDPPQLSVALPADDNFGRKLVEACRDEVVAILRELAGPQAALTIIEGAPAAGPDAAAAAAVRAAKPPAPSQAATNQRRELLEDHRLRSLLDVFPGAEVEDIRFRQ